MPLRRTPPLPCHSVRGRFCVRVRRAGSSPSCGPAPSTPHRGDPAVVVDDVDHDQVGRGAAAVGERRPDPADVGAGVAAGLANESLISNSNVAIGAIASSQNAEMPAWPRWPCPLVEHRRADRVLEDGVLGVHREPLGEVALGHRGVGALRGDPGRVVVVRCVPGDGVGGDGRGAHDRHRRAKLEHVLVRWGRHVDWPLTPVVSSSPSGAHGRATVGAWPSRSRSSSSGCRTPASRC